jgi:chemotaxis protein CheD
MTNVVPNSDPKSVVRPTQFLQAGQLVVSSTPLSVVTILGSCVSVCLFDAIARIGGINHYLLPWGAPEGLTAARYGNTALQQLFDKIAEAGAKKNRLIAAVFGGAAILNTPPERSRPPLGTQNVQLALKVLKDEHIVVQHMEVEGDCGRKLTFQTDTGFATVKNI